MTNEQLQAENERLGKEVAALRTLLRAVRDLADMPPPADYGDKQYYFACASRIDAISVYANPDMTVDDGPRTATMLHNAAEDLYKEAARPLPYTPKPAPADDAWRLTPKGVEAADAAVITDSERTCDERNPDGSGEPCHRGGDHGVHRDSNGDEWRTDGPGGLLVGPFDADVAAEL